MLNSVSLIAGGRTRINSVAKPVQGVLSKPALFVSPMRWCRVCAAKRFRLNKCRKQPQATLRTGCRDMVRLWGISRVSKVGWTSTDSTYFWTAAANLYVPSLHGIPLWDGIHCVHPEFSAPQEASVTVRENKNYVPLFSKNCTPQREGIGWQHGLYLAAEAREEPQYEWKLTPQLLMKSECSAFLRARH